MASILLVFAIAALGVIVFWYVFDEATRGGEGKSGLLGMQDYGHAPRKSESGSSWKRGNTTPWRVRRH